MHTDCVSFPHWLGCWRMRPSLPLGCGGEHCWEHGVQDFLSRYFAFFGVNI